MVVFAPGICPAAFRAGYLRQLRYWPFERGFGRGVRGFESRDSLEGRTILADELTSQDVDHSYSFTKTLG